MLKPLLDELKAEGQNIEVIDIDEDRMIAGSKGIMSVPTLILYEDGVEVGRASGVPSKSEIKEWLHEG
jgi:thioredoxin 1